MARHARLVPIQDGWRKETQQQGIWKRKTFLPRLDFAREGVRDSAGPPEIKREEKEPKTRKKAKRTKDVIASPGSAVRPHPRLFVFCRQPNPTAMEEAEIPNGIPGLIG